MRYSLAKFWRFLKIPTRLQVRIMHMVQDQFLVGVTGVIFNDNGDVLLFKHTYRQIEWSLPGGFIKKGEHPKEALEREVFEESGFVVSADESIRTQTDREGARLDISIHGHFVGGEFRPSHEVVEYGFFAPDSLPSISKSQLLLIDRAINGKAR